MKPKCIGLIGGAGPMAGAYLLQRIFALAGTHYGCHRDSDFPKVILISFPFSEMLDINMNPSVLQQELSECLQQLRSNGAAVLGVACNTVHAFLDKNEETGDLVHLPRILAEEVMLSHNPLVLCTSTSVRFGLHKQFFPCSYPDERSQQELDIIIDHILQGQSRSLILERLEKLIRRQASSVIILGCTELSLFASQLFVLNKKIIDPIEVMANKILERSFMRKP